MLRKILSIIFITAGISHALLAQDVVINKVWNNNDNPIADRLDKDYVDQKKGFCFNTSRTDWEERIFKVKPFWYYTWGSTLRETSPKNVEYVPQFSRRSYVTDENISEMKRLAAEGKIKYLLGFNEPDLSSQANMSPREAIDLWPQLESIGVPLGSPAVAWPSSQWLKDFMALAKAEGRRVDFICLHYYPGPATGNFIRQIEQVYLDYGLPIWITEFAVADDDASTQEENRYSPERVLEFMKELLPILDSKHYIQRYSWFSGAHDSKRLWPSALFDENLNLTSLGEFYMNYKPNNAITR